MSSTCQCPSPPGGQVSCEAYQLAVCSIRNGVTHAACYTPTSAVNSQLNLNNWTLEIVTGSPRSLEKSLTAHEKGILERATYERRDGTLVHFHMPLIGFRSPSGSGSFGSGFGSSFS